jgi:hypothetical protein
MAAAEPATEALPPSTARRLFWAVLAIVPFMLLYVSHYSRGDSATGFVQGDMPYYSANGRAVFERGNGFSHPNPFDPDPHSPAIYFHWLTWLLGFGITKLGLDPGSLHVGIGVVAALVCSWLTFRLVEAVLPDPRYRIGLFLVAMWGGGLLCFYRGADNLLHHRGVTDNLFLYDNARGWWILNWGRNLIFTTEAVYHAVMAGTWLAVLRGRWGWAVSGTGLLAATHPFSGLQILLIMLAWLTIVACTRPTRAVIVGWIATAAILTAFAWYYFVFLESFEGHRKLREVWSIDTRFSAASAWLSLGPVGLIALVRLWRDRRSLGVTVGFLGVCFAVSLLLCKHEWFVRSRQPIHFNRGYLWLPLLLIALPAVQQMLTWTRARLRPAAFAAVGVGLIGFAALDNAAFLWTVVPIDPYGHTMSPDLRAVFARMNRERLNGVLLTPYPDVSYLSATYSPARPYCGSATHTPDYAVRIAHVESWASAGPTTAWLSEVDYLLLRTVDLPLLRDRSVWQPWFDTGEFILFKKAVAPMSPGDQLFLSRRPGI